MKFKGLSDSSSWLFCSNSFSSYRYSSGGLNDSACPGNSLFGAGIALGAYLGFHGTIVSSSQISQTFSSYSLSLSSLSFFFSSKVFILPCFNAFKNF